MSNYQSELDRQGLRGFLEFIEREFPDQLLRIGEPVQIRSEMTAIVFELERAGRSPVVIFENVVGRIDFGLEPVLSRGQTSHIDPLKSELFRIEVGPADGYAVESTGGRDAV